jgi:hypothetical protein
MAAERPLGASTVTRTPVAHRVLGTSAPAALLVAGGLLATIVARYFLALDQPAPWLMGDELRYAEMAKSFLDEGRLLFREEVSSFATAYPALIAPAWAAEEVSTAYRAAKAINVVLMTMTAAVVFVWARRLVTVPAALVAAGLVLLMPTFVYTGMILMESAALPAFVLGTFVISRALERPTLGWQLAVFATAAVATLLRIQLVTLILVYATAILLEALFAWRAERRSLRASIRRFAASFAIVLVGAAGYVILKLLSGAGLASGLGAYAPVGKAEYDLVDTVRWSLWHAGELALSVGFLPVVALGVLLAAAAGRGLPAVADRAFVAVACASAFWFVLQSAAFAARFTQRIEERYMVYAAPLLLLALLVWLQRTLPRRSVAAFVAALVPALLVMTIPYERLFNVPILADTLALIPFLRLSTFLDAPRDLSFVIAGGLGLATIAFLTVGRAAANVLFPAAIAAFFALSSYTVYGALEVQSEGAAASTGVSNRGWVDDAVGRAGQAGFVFTEGLSANPHVLWQTEFWNRHVDDVYVLGANRALAYSDDEITIDGRGHLVPETGGDVRVDEPYLLTDPALGLVGDVVAQAGPLALIRINPPARIGSRLDGVYADRWSGPSAGLSQYEPLAGGARRIKVEVSRAGWGGPDVPGKVEIDVGALRMTEAGPALTRVTASRRWTVHSSLARTFVLPVPPAPFRVEVRVTPTFSPAQFGHGDARQLGAQLTFAPA